MNLKSIFTYTTVGLHSTLCEETNNLQISTNFIFLQINKKDFFLHWKDLKCTIWQSVKTKYGN